MYRLHHPSHPRLHRNKHSRRNRTRLRNGILPFKFLRKQSQPKSQVLRKRHTIMRTHRRLLPICVKSVLTRCRILLPLQQQRRPPTAGSRIKTSQTSQRRRPCHVNGDAPSSLVCDGSGGRCNILRLPRRRPSLQHFIQPWTCSGSNPDNNGQCLLQRHFEQHRQAKTVKGYGHAVLLGEMQNRPGPIQNIVAIWPRKSRRLLHKTACTSAPQKQMDNTA